MIRILPGTVLLGALILSGCAASRGEPAPDPGAGSAEHGGHVHPTGPMVSTGPAAADEHAHHHMLPAHAGPGYTVDDVIFMQMMMGHHAQAVTMSEMAATRDSGPRIKALAQRIDISQRDEMALMSGWLRDRGQVVPDEEQMHSMQMPGMVSREDMERLSRAGGETFDRLFLNLMIEHHLGAIRMVDDLFASPGSAQDPDLFRFVTDVSADQLDEIAVMERILYDEDPTPRSSSR
jgi:uncharacterized protein (DUF305 family)